MMHLLLGIPAKSIRMTPFITAVNHIPTMTARDVGLNIHPDATVDCLPGVASYVGADISAGVLSSGLDDTDLVTIFIDVGTNGEIVLGNQEWLVTVACSAGPAFEGGGVQSGMRATRGAIEEVWINGETYEPTYPRDRQRQAAGYLRQRPDLAAGGVVPDRDRRQGRTRQPDRANAARSRRRARPGVCDRLGGGHQHWA